MRTARRGSSEPREPSVSIPLDEAFFANFTATAAAQPRHFMSTPVSSMKTSLSGSSSGWFSAQASRRLRTPGCCCSAACVRRLFFNVMPWGAKKRQSVRADSETRAPPGKTPLQFGERDVLAIHDRLHDEGAMRLNPLRTPEHTRSVTHAYGMKFTAVSEGAPYGVR